MQVENQVDRRGKRKAFLRTLEVALMFTAILCLGTFVAVSAYRWTSSRSALRNFDEAKAHAGTAAETRNAGPLISPKDVDFSLWSEKRVRAYHDTLSQSYAGPMAVLTIPRFNIRVAVIEGTDEFALNRGAGWIEGTARPGSPGNIGIAGHRDGFFRALKDIREGDEIELATITDTSRYKVDQIEIVTPDDVTVLGKRQTDSITLVTCYPFYFVGDAPQRWIVHATRQPGPN